jgi:hypothetical protein
VCALLVGLLELRDVFLDIPRLVVVAEKIAALFH